MEHPGESGHLSSAGIDSNPWHYHRHGAAVGAFSRSCPAHLEFYGRRLCFVAHNVDFDRDFLNIHLSRAGHEVMPNPYLCTQKLAKRVHPNLTKYGLGALSEVFGIELPQAHRALHDARATAELLIKFLRVLQNGGPGHEGHSGHSKPPQRGEEFGGAGEFVLEAESICSFGDSVL